MSLGTRGQNGGVTFSGTNAQVITVRVTSNSIGSVTVTLKRPNGTTQTSSVSSATTFNLAQQTLSTSGTYAIAVDPVGANSGGLTVAVTSP